MKRIILLTTVLIGLSTLVGCPGKPSPAGPSQPTRTATPTTSATATVTETFSTTPTSSPSPTSTQASTSTDTSTPTVTLTLSSTPTLTLTPTATPSPTRTVTPTPSCSGPYHFGYDAVGAQNFTLATDYVYCVAATLTAPATLTSISCRLGLVGGSLRVGIYDDLANWPNSLKAESAATTGVPNSWNTLTVPPVSLPPGTYWLAIQAQAGVYLYMEPFGTGATRRSAAQSFGPFMSSFPNDGTLPIYQTFSIYANYCVGAGTPTPVNTPVFTGTPTITSTPTVTPTHTSEPAACVSPYHFGYDAVGAQNFTLATDYVYCVAATLTAPATLTSISCRLGLVGGSLRVGIYDDLANWPNQLKAESGTTTGVPNSWNDINVLDTVLAPGAYWLAIQAQAGVYLYMEPFGAGATRRSAAQSFGPFMSSFPNDGTLPIYQTFSIYANYCVGAGTPTPVNTPVFTGTPTITSTPTVTPTHTSEPAACVSPYHFGYDAVGAQNFTLATDYVYCVAATLTAPATLTSISCRLGLVGGSLRVGIYDDLANWPNQLKAESGTTTGVPNSWNDINVLDTVLAPGAYWLAIQAQAGVYLYMEPFGAGATRRSAAQSFGPFMSSFPNDGTLPIYQTFSIYANYCVGAGTPTPVNTPTFTPTP